MNIGKSKMAKRCWPTMEAEVANYSKFIFRIWNDRTSHTIGSTRTAWHHPKIRNLRMEMMRHITSKKSRRGIIIHKKIRIMIKFSMNRWWIQWIRNQMRQNSVYRKRWLPSHPPSKINMKISSLRPIIEFLIWIIQIDNKRITNFWQKSYRASIATNWTK